MGKNLNDFYASLSPRCPKNRQQREHPITPYNVIRRFLEGSRLALNLRRVLAVESKGYHHAKGVSGPVCPMRPRCHPVTGIDGSGQSLDPHHLNMK